jgi:hypothetical protein
VTVAAGEGGDLDTSRADQEDGPAATGADEPTEVHEHLQAAIESLQALDSAL